jgi:hypothetical protein
MEEKQKAEQKYEDAVAYGDMMAVISKYVGSSDSMRLISCNMGNFPPNCKATLTCYMTS